MGLCPQLKTFPARPDPALSIPEFSAALAKVSSCVYQECAVRANTAAWLEPAHEKKVARRFLSRMIGTGFHDVVMSFGNGHRDGETGITGGEWKANFHLQSPSGRLNALTVPP